MCYLLFRLDAPQDALRAPDKLEQGLRRHIAVASLLSLVVQIGERQQAYVALEGCNGCATSRCIPGCRVELFRRTARAGFASAGSLHPVAKGLTSRAYTRVVLARPRRGAQMLRSEVLHPYHDARLMLHWRGAAKGALRLSAVLLVGEDGPDPVAVVQEHGWQTFVVPRSVIKHATSMYGSNYPKAQPINALWPHEPALLLATTVPVRQAIQVIEAPVAERVAVQEVATPVAPPTSRAIQAPVVRTQPVEDALQMEQNQQIAAQPPLVEEPQEALPISEAIDSAAAVNHSASDSTEAPHAAERTTAPASPELAAHEAVGPASAGTADTATPSSELVVSLEDEPAGDQPMRVPDMPATHKSALPVEGGAESLVIGHATGMHAEPVVLSGVPEMTVGVEDALVTMTERQERAVLRESTYTHLKEILEGRSTLQRQPTTIVHAGVPSTTTLANDQTSGAAVLETNVVESPWPHGPGEGKAMMRPEAVEACVIKLIHAPDVVQGDEAGLTRKRVATQLEGQHKEHASVLLLWFEAAGLLEQPLDANQPYRRPRTLTVLDSTIIGERLKATPRPTTDDIAAAKAKGL